MDLKELKIYSSKTKGIVLNNQYYQSKELKALLTFDKKLCQFFVNTSNEKVKQVFSFFKSLIKVVEEKNTSKYALYKYYNKAQKAYFIHL